MSDNTQEGSNHNKTDNSQPDKQEKCISYRKCFRPLIVAIILVCNIPWVVYLLIMAVVNYINSSRAAPIQIAANSIDSIATCGSSYAFEWPLALVLSIGICANVFILYKVISVIRDLIENEQINRYYNITQSDKRKDS